MTTREPTPTLSPLRIGTAQPRPPAPRDTGPQFGSSKASSIRSSRSSRHSRESPPVAPSSGEARKEPSLQIPGRGGTLPGPPNSPCRRISGCLSILTCTPTGTNFTSQVASLPSPGGVSTGSKADGPEVSQSPPAVALAVLGYDTRNDVRPQESFMRMPARRTSHASSRCRAPRIAAGAWGRVA